MTVKSDLKEATVYIDDADAGDLENGVLKLKLAQGEYKISIKMDGYDTASKKIVLKESKILDFGEIYKNGGPYPITIKAKLKSKVYFKDKYLGETPQIIKLKKGEYKIKMYNELAGYKTQKLNISKPETFSYKMNKKFEFVDFNIGMNFIYTDFPFQRNSSHILFGFDIKVLKWIWKYIEIDVLGAGFYFGLDSDKMVKLHLAGVSFKPIKDLKINLSIGPLLGDFINLYDNIQDSYMTLGGLKLEYSKIIKEVFYIKADTSIYYATKNSEKSFYSDDSSMDNGLLFSIGISAGMVY